jgi:ABC-2 type transport system ATP-binding protein
MATAADSIIEVQGLVFEYPGVRALDDVSVTIRRGEIAALVGPNGAGKTTLLRCLAALDQPIAGSIRVDGVDALDSPRECHRRLGYLPDFFGLYRDLTASQCLSFVARANGIEPHNVPEAVGRAASRLQLSDRLHDKAGTLSRGLSQRLAIAQAIVHEPGVLLLDEPASGLDPEARNALAQLFLDLRDQGMTLVVSSHILAELESYSTTMLILRHGRVVEHESLQGGGADLTTPMHLTLSAPHPALESLLVAAEGVNDCRIDNLGARFRFAGDAQARHRLLKQLIDAGVPVAGFAEERVNLQDAYLERVREMDEGRP